MVKLVQHDVFVADDDDLVVVYRQDVSRCRAGIRYIVKVKVVLVCNLDISQWRDDVDWRGSVEEGVRRERDFAILQQKRF